MPKQIRKTRNKIRHRIGKKNMGPAVFVVRMLGHWQQQKKEGGGARLDGILAGQEWASH